MLDSKCSINETTGLHNLMSQEWDSDTFPSCQENVLNTHLTVALQKFIVLVKKDFFNTK